MQLLPHQRDIHALRDLVRAGLQLLATNQLESLVEGFGYAMALGRNPVEAIRADLAQALVDRPGNQILQVQSSDLPVVFYQDNRSCLRASIDCELSAEPGRRAWVSFVVTGTETEQFLTLEDIAGEPKPG